MEDESEFQSKRKRYISPITKLENVLSTSKESDIPAENGVISFSEKDPQHSFHEQTSSDSSPVLSSLKIDDFSGHSNLPKIVLRPYRKSEIPSEREMTFFSSVSRQYELFKKIPTDSSPAFSSLQSNNSLENNDSSKDIQQPAPVLITANQNDEIESLNFATSNAEVKNESIPSDEIESFDFATRNTKVKIEINLPKNDEVASVDFATSSTEIKTEINSSQNDQVTSSDFATSSTEMKIESNPPQKFEDIWQINEKCYRCWYRVVNDFKNSNYRLCSDCYNLIQTEAKKGKRKQSVIDEKFNELYNNIVASIHDLCQKETIDLSDDEEDAKFKYFCRWCGKTGERKSDYCNDCERKIFG